MPSLPAIVVPAKAFSSALRPFGFGDRIRFSRQVMIEDEFVHVCAFGDAADLGDIGMELRHSLEVGAGKAVSLEVVEVCHLVDEHVGIPGESDQVFVHRGVTREHDRAVRSIETVGESRVRVAVRHGDSRDPDDLIFETVIGRPESPAIGAGTEMSIARTSTPGSGMWQSRGMTFRW